MNEMYCKSMHVDFIYFTNIPYGNMQPADGHHDNERQWTRFLLVVGSNKSDCSVSDPVERD